MKVLKKDKGATSDCTREMSKTGRSIVRCRSKEVGCVGEGCEVLCEWLKWHLDWLCSSSE